MYEVVFHTNVDCPVGTWSFPKKVVCIPEIGHKIQSMNGPTLKVCSITHCWREGRHSADTERGPYLKIELTKENW